MSIELPTNYSPVWCDDGMYKDTFNEQFERDFYSVITGVVCKCSNKKTIFKKMNRLRRHCRGKTHQKYLSTLAAPDDNSLRELDVDSLTNQLGNLDIDDETVEIVPIEKSDDECLNMEEIALLCKEKIVDMEGDWVVPKNNYEKDFCALLDWECIPKGRYYDAKSKKCGTYIEIKKGQGGMWFDMVRYAEIVLGTGPQNTATVFFKWNKKRKQVGEILVIDTKDLIDFLKVDEEMANIYLKIFRHVPRGVNILASATVKDLRGIASFVVTESTFSVK